MLIPRRILDDKSLALAQIAQAIRKGRFLLRFPAKRDQPNEPNLFFPSLDLSGLLLFPTRPLTRLSRP